MQRLEGYGRTIRPILHRGIQLQDFSDEQSKSHDKFQSSRGTFESCSHCSECIKHTFATKYIESKIFTKGYFGSILYTICVSQITTIFRQQGLCGSTSDSVKSKVDSRNIKTWNLRKQITASYEVQYKSTTLHTDGPSKYQLKLNNCQHIPHILKQTIGSVNCGLTNGNTSLQGSVAILNKSLSAWIILLVSAYDVYYSIFSFCVITLLSVHYLPKCVNFRKVMSFRIT